MGITISLGIIAVAIPIILLISKAKKPSIYVVISFVSCIGAVTILMNNLYQAVAFNKPLFAKTTELTMSIIITLIVLTMILDVIVLIQKIKPKLK